MENELKDLTVKVSNLMDRRDEWSRQIAQGKYAEVRQLQLDIQEAKRLLAQKHHD